jgi:hypothetical protein
MATYKPLQSISLTSSTASVTFSGIDQNYTDLILTVNGTTPSNVDSYCRINGISSSIYSYNRLYGTGSSTVAADRSSDQTEFKAGNFNTTPNTHTLHFMNYSSTSVNKTMLFNTREPASAIILHTCLWRSTSAINSINIYVTSGSFNAGSTFDLYGIKSGAPQALGGDLVTTDGNYWYHTFNSTQVFTPLKTLSVDYLVVAGGGGGAGSVLNGNGTPGGGAGGLRSTVTATGGGGTLESALSMAPGSYAVTVGAGGAGGGTGGTSGAKGSDSVFSTITSTGGGFGRALGGSSPYDGGVGGSGGGGVYVPSSGGAGTANQGYAGGAGSSYNGSTYYPGGGGGGAGGVGQAGSTNSIQAGNGGIGVATSISGTSTYYAGGGGGTVLSNSTGGYGTGGTGGGGNGGGASSSVQSGVAGTANTGGGGGGGKPNGSTGASGGAGGSGIVIVRYPV